MIGWRCGRKAYGIWQEYTWNDVYQHVHDFCLGLVSLGLTAGETVAIIGDNDPEFYWAQIAAHSTRAMSFGIFSDAGSQELIYGLTKSKAVFLLAQDQEQVDKALEIKEQVPNIRKVIYWDDQGLWNYDDPLLASFEDIEALGRQYAIDHPGLYEKLVAETERQDVVLLSMTSGTTSLPKLAMISNWRLVYGNEVAFTISHRILPNRQLAVLQPDGVADRAGVRVHALPDGRLHRELPGRARHRADTTSAKSPRLDCCSQAGCGKISPAWCRCASMTVRGLIDCMYRTFLPVAYRVIDLEDERKAIPLHIRLRTVVGRVRGVPTPARQDRPDAGAQRL